MTIKSALTLAYDLTVYLNSSIVAIKQIKIINSLKFCSDYLLKMCDFY